MSFRYFAYGSNLWPPQLRSRCPSARPIGPARLSGWRLVCDKPSRDGSSKLNIRPHREGSVAGVVYEIDDDEGAALDQAEPLYQRIDVDIDGLKTLTYLYEGTPSAQPAYDWYLATARAGANRHGLDSAVFDFPEERDPLVSGIRPAGRESLSAMAAILSAGLARGGDRFFIHPGDLAWWLYHDDPRYPDHFSCWIQDDVALLTVDSRAPHEINVFAPPEIDRMPLVHWAQRRLGGEGEVGGVADSDTELVTALQTEGYRPLHAFRDYRWPLDGDLPTPDPPSGWQLRHLRGEEEAQPRRAASHAAFESSMPPDLHLQRYLAFMRSPVYDPRRDLVAARPDGTIGAFMIWWPDPSGIAQIEPFGTHPHFQRMGLGRALLYHGLAEMKRAGMKMARVCTDDYRPATSFYAASGFIDVGRLTWWGRT